MLAYLVIREGAKWTDVFRLVPGQTFSIGRAPNNHIILQDDRCSRNHCEVYQDGSEWRVRDLGSRNGTNVADGLIQGEHVLEPGDIIRIGRSQLKFVHDLAKAFPESSGGTLDLTDGKNGESAIDPEEM